MRVSAERLRREASATGFRAEVLEKVIHLLHLLATIETHPFLHGRLVLKGGTALNLFLFDVPRLSVDIDLNYVGAVPREEMLVERPKLEDALRAVFQREGYSVIRVPADHAGGRWDLRYESAAGQGGNLKVDLNYMFRVPLWGARKLRSRPIGSLATTETFVLDIHELAAGKLAALFSRNAARDLYDAHELLTKCDLTPERLRVAFVVYGAINRRDWRTVSISDVAAAGEDVRTQLLPTLRREDPETMDSVDQWVERMVHNCREHLTMVLPLNDFEKEFLDRLLDHGESEPSLLTGDAELVERIRRHPGLAWKALNVRQFRSGPA